MLSGTSEIPNGGKYEHPATTAPCHSLVDDKDSLGHNAPVLIYAPNTQ